VDTQESVELPLTHPEYYEEMGIKPPKGVILYGAPGTGQQPHLSAAAFVLVGLNIITIISLQTLQIWRKSVW